LAEQILDISLQANAKTNQASKAPRLRGNADEIGIDDISRQLELIAIADWV